MKGLLVVEFITSTTLPLLSTSSPPTLLDVPETVTSIFKESISEYETVPSENVWHPEPEQPGLDPLNDGSDKSIGIIINDIAIVSSIKVVFIFSPVCLLLLANQQ